MKVTPEELLYGLKAGKRYVTEDGAEFTLHYTSNFILLDDWYYHVQDPPIASLLKRIEVTVIEPEPDVIVRDVVFWADSGKRPGYKCACPLIWCKPDKVADVEKALKELAEGKRDG